MKKWGGEEKSTCNLSNSRQGCDRPVAWLRSNLGEKADPEGPLLCVLYKQLLLCPDLRAQEDILV